MTASFGAFGKIPSLGDFFRVDLPQGFVDPWDRWLQEGMVAAKGSLGSRWQDCYFTAPIWRFTLAPGLAGAAAMIGVMMMSVDRVGRQFPLTFAAPLPDEADPAAQHLLGGHTFAALETIALDSLEDGMTRDALAERLAALGPAPLQEVPAVRRRPGSLVYAGVEEPAPLLAVDALRAVARRPSIWSFNVEGASRLMVCEGLPAGGLMVGLFDAESRVWTGRDPVAEAIPEPAEDVPAPSVAVAVAAPLILRPAPVAAAPLDDPLADILLPDEPVLALSDDASDDPLADILAAGDPLPEDEASPAKET